MNQLNHLLYSVLGIDIKEFEGYDLGLVATKEFIQGSLLLTVPRKLMMTEQDARESALAEFITVDPLLQNMANITLALFLLLEKNNPGKHHIMLGNLMVYNNEHNNR